MSGLTQAVRSIRSIWNHGEEEYADDDNDFNDDEETPQTPAATNRTPQTSSYDAQPRTSYGGGAGAGSGVGTSGVKRLRSVATPLRAREKNIYTLRPKTQEDAAIAADALKSGDAVIINLEEVERSKAVRIIDFMSGVCYGLEGQGHAMKLGDLIFLYTPPEFEITSDETDYGENTDFFFRDVENAPPKSSTATIQNVGAPTVSPSPLNAQISAQRDFQRDNLRVAQAAQSQTIPQSSTGSQPIPSQQSPSQQGAQPIPQQSFSPQSYGSAERRPWER